MEDNQLAIKVFKIDYSFIIRNYLNPEMWKKTWTLFQYKTFTVTLNIYRIETKEEKIMFEIRIYYHDLDSEEVDNYVYTFISCSLKLEDITFMKRQINSAIYNLITTCERCYFIKKTEEYEQLEDQRDKERYRLRKYANEFLDECGVTSDACRETYIDAYVDENEKMCDLIDEYEDEQIYQLIPDFYLTFLSSLDDDDPKKTIRKEEIEKKLGNNKLKEVLDEIKSFTIFMEDEENFEKEMKDRLEEV